MDLSLALQLFLIVVFLRQARFHLFETLIVHFSRIGMASDHRSAEMLGQHDPNINGHIRVIRVIYRDINPFVHGSPP